MRDKQRSAALALRSSGSQLSAKGIAFNFILRTTRRNWRHSGSIDPSVVALYGQIRHIVWRVSDWPVIDAAYWLAVFPRRGWPTELCRTPFDSGLPMDAKVPQRQVARSFMSPATLSVVLLSHPRGALHGQFPQFPQALRHFSCACVACCPSGAAGRLRAIDWRVTAS